MKPSNESPSGQARILELLNGCPETRLMVVEAGKVLARHAELEQHQAGSTLWSQGEAPLNVFVTSGPARIGILAADGNFITTLLVRDSHVLGEAEVFAGLVSRPNEVSVLVPQEVLRIPAQIFLQCVEGFPAITRAWLKMSNQRFLLQVRHAQSLAQRSAEERLQAMLKMLLLYTPADADGTITLPFSQEDLGAMAALTRPATAKVVAGWRSCGLVDTSYQSLRVLQPEHFRRSKG